VEVALKVAIPSSSGQSFQRRLFKRTDNEKVVAIPSSSGQSFQRRHGEGNKES